MIQGHRVLVMLLVWSVYPCRAQSSVDELARLLRDRQIITSAEFDRLTGAGSDGVEQLAAILRDKGVITPADAASLHAVPSAALGNRGRMLAGRLQK